MTNPTRSPADVLIAHGFRPVVNAKVEEDFVRACKDGLVEVVTAWLDLGMSPNARQPISHETALIKAAEGGQNAVIDVLLARGGDPELRDSSDDTAFRTSLNWSHYDTSRHLASKGVDVNAPSKYGDTCLEHAIDDGKDDQIPLLLELGAKPGFAMKGRSAMRSVIEKSRHDVMVQLLDKGASPSMVLDEQGDSLNAGITALQLAIQSNNSEAARTLLERGANIDAKDGFGLTAIDYALLKDRFFLDELCEKSGRQPAAPQQARAEVWELMRAADLDAAFAALEKNDVSVDARDANHSTFLMHFAKEGNVDAVRRLLDRGANPELWAGTTSALGNAMASDHDSSTEIVKLLLAKRPPLIDKNGEAAGLQSAVWSGHVEKVKAFLGACTTEEKSKCAPALKSGVMQKNVDVVRAFVDAGVPVNHKDDIGGDTPLMSAVSSWHSVDVVKALLDGGADLSLSNYENPTSPLHKLLGHYQWDEGYEQSLKLLLERGARTDTIDWLGQTPYDACHSYKDEQKAAFVKVLVEEPLARGETIDQLAKRHTWATLPLFLAAGKPELIPQLVDAGVAVDPPAGAKANSVLMRAVESQDETLVRALIARRADPNRAENYGSTPLSTAANKESTAILKLLLDNGGDVSVQVYNGSIACSAAGSPDNLRLLKQAGARFDDPVDGPLLAAVWSDKDSAEEAVRLLIEWGAVLDTRDSYGRIPLVSAIEKDKPALAKLLIAAGASPNAVARDTGDTALHAAAKKGDVDLVRQLLAKGGSLDAKNKDGDDTVTLILRRRALRASFADVLAQKGIDVTVPKLEPLDASLTSCSDGWAAVYSGDTDKVLAAIDSGAVGVNDKDPWGTTPLMVAVLARNNWLIEQLLDKGADPDIEDNHKSMAGDYLGFQRDSEIDGLLARKAKQRAPSMDRLNAQAGRSLIAEELTKAVDRGEIRKLAALLKDKKVHPFLCFDGDPLVIRLLRSDDEDLINAAFELGLSPNVSTRYGESPLFIALRDEKLELAERLLAAGARADATALVRAIDDGNDSAVNWLLEHGVDINGQASDGRAPMHIACERGNKKLVTRFLKKDRALVNARDKQGRTPLMLCVENWYSGKKVAKQLLDAGADLSATDAQGRTALHIAIDAYSEPAAKLLLERGASWDAFDPSVPGAMPARAYAQERGMEAGWPNAPQAEHSDDDDDGDSDDDDDGDDD